MSAPLAPVSTTLTWRMPLWWHPSPPPGHRAETPPTLREALKIRAGNDYQRKRDVATPINAN